MSAAASPTVLGIPIPPALILSLAPILAACEADGVTLVDAVDAARVDRERWVREHAEPVRA